MVEKKKKPLKLTTNQKEHLFALASIMTQSALSSRADLQGRMGYAYGGDRDVYTALGYKKVLDFPDFEAKYKRQDIASRIIDLPVKATWRLRPEIVEKDGKETPFEKGWMALVKEKKVFHYLQRVDRLSGIGQYGVLLIGYDDSKELSEPVEKATDILFLRPFKQSTAEISTWQKDTTKKRYGLPETYKLTFTNAEAQGTASKEVHHSRVIHIAEGLDEDNVYGKPRLEVVYNRLMNMELVAGGSAEMFWRGAFPGMGFGIDKDVDVNTLDLDDMKDEMEDYIHGFKRTLRTQGVDVQQFAPQVADPSNHISVLLDLISAATGIPKRILMGSERGELASSQDETNWNNTIDERRMNHAEPIILRPFIDRNIETGVLPKPADEYTVNWPDLQIKSEKEEADVAKIKSEALNKYLSTPGADMVIPIETFLDKFMGFTKEEIEDIVKKIGEYEKEEVEEIDEGAEEE